MAGKPCKTIHPELQKKAIIEEIWLKYYNQALFEEGLITQREYSLMIHRIDARTATYLSR